MAKPPLQPRSLFIEMTYKMLESSTNEGQKSRKSGFWCVSRQQSHFPANRKIASRKSVGTMSPQRTRLETTQKIILDQIPPFVINFTSSTILKKGGALHDPPHFCHLCSCPHRRFGWSDRTFAECACCLIIYTQCISATDTPCPWPFFIYFPRQPWANPWPPDLTPLGFPISERNGGMQGRL